MTSSRRLFMRIYGLAVTAAITFASFASTFGAPPLRAQAPAQPTAGSVLRLADAIAIARRNSPTYQTSLNARSTAAATVRAANGALLPSINTSASGGYREGRQTFFQGQAFGSTNNTLSTDVSANASLNISVSALNDRRGAKANVDATEADIVAAEQRVKNDVTTQYLTALQAQTRAALQDSLVATTAIQLQLARARLQVGTGTQLDVQQAEVADGQQRVAVLTQRNQAAIEVVRLFQTMGVAPVAGVLLDPNLPAAPTIELQNVLDMARKSNPALEALRAREQVTGFSLASAHGAYFPSLSLSASISGSTNRYTDTDLLISQGQASTASSKAGCIRSEEVRAALGLSNSLSTCNSITFTPAAEASIRDAQGRYPFNYTRNPYSLSAQFSLPIFNGFRREQSIESANVQHRNAENDVRAQELRIVADVTTAFITLSGAQQTVALQEQIVRTARTALSLAQERYRVGSSSIVDLQKARGDYEKAESDRITAVYDVQRAFTTLEAAAGRPLR